LLYSSYYLSPSYSLPPSSQSSSSLLLLPYEEEDGEEGKGEGVRRMEMKEGERQ
jgi:hypothetical protein